VKPALKVLAPGTHTTVQDLGRFGYQHIGVPVSGALDSVSLRLGNALVGNPPGAAGLELLYRGPELEVCAPSVRVALTGTAAGLELPDSGRVVPPWRSVCLRRGQVLRVGALADSTCAYLAVAGGFDLSPCLGSLATYVRAGLGGYQGRALAAGDRIPLGRGRAPEVPEVRVSAPPRVPQWTTLRVVLGPQQYCFTRRAVATLLRAPYTVSADSDRMGMRLRGPRLEHAGGYDIVSDALPTGSIQVPGAGAPILLLNDRQTTGGYPKIATVISADWPAAGRARPGAVVRFQALGVAAAERLRRAQERWLEALCAGLVPVAGEPGGIDRNALYQEDLASGVWPPAGWAREWEPPDGLY